MKTRTLKEVNQLENSTDKIAQLANLYWATPDDSFTVALEAAITQSIIKTRLALGLSRKETNRLFNVAKAAIRSV